MAEGYQNKYLGNIVVALNSNVAYSTNAEMFSAIANYIGTDGVHSFVNIITVRCSEAPLSGASAYFMMLGDNVWGSGLGWNSGGLYRLAFNNSVGSITKILNA